ncbi:MAG TPA: hypothetical protein VFN11_00245, partial [Ktedonobacterales bacterium]|nr:hypothetical protein [Ktedonobacterales bacterium]
GVRALTAFHVKRCRLVSVALPRQHHNTSWRRTETRNMRVSPLDSQHPCWYDKMNASVRMLAI